MNYVDDVHGCQIWQPGVHQPDFCATQLMVPTPLRSQEIPQMNPDKAHYKLKTILGYYIMKLIERRPRFCSAVNKGSIVVMSSVRIYNVNSHENKGKPLNEKVCPNF